MSLSACVFCSSTYVPKLPPLMTSRELGMHVLRGGALCLACTRPWLPPQHGLVGCRWEGISSCLYNYCVLFTRSQCVHAHAVRRGRHITYTNRPGALVLVQCGHSVAGVLFLVGWWVLCDWGLFCIPEGTQKSHPRREDPWLSVGTRGQTSCVGTALGA